jgi:hypothetical protein
MTPARVCAFLPVLAALAASAATAITPAAAAEPFAHVPSYSMTFLSLPQGPRNFAMGWTGVADDASPSNVFYNPANIAFYDRAYWNANYLDWPFELYFFDIGVFGGHAFELSGDHTLYVSAAVRYFRMDVDVDSERTIFLPDGVGKEFDPAEWAVPLSVAAGFSTRHVDIGIGSTVKFATSEFGDETFHATGLDVGAIARTRVTPWDNAELSLTLGASAINLGNGPTYGSLKSDFPLEYHVGLGVGLAGYSGDSRGAAALWRVNGNVENIDTDFGEDFAFGVEFGVLDMAFLRVGRRGEELSMDGDYWGFGLSARIESFVLSADYAQTSSTGYFWDQKPHCFGLSGTYRY